MLCLTRSKGQQIKIGDHITVVVVRIKGGAVKLGIEAPKEIPVDRQEVHEKKKREAA